LSLAAFIASQRTCHRVPHAFAYRALGVSESWFYTCRDRKPTPAQQRRAALDAKVAEIFADSGGEPDTYGSPRIHAELRDLGWRVSEKTVAASMARQGLVARPKRRFRCLTRPDGRAVPFPDLIKRDFSATAPNEKWCGDMTEIPTLEGKLYLADVEDLFNRRIAGFAIGEHTDAELANTAIQTAVAIRDGTVAGMIFHPDRGSTYTADAFTKACDHHKIRQSIGHTRSCLDNATAESFFPTLEHELLSRTTSHTKDETRRRVTA
jgi:transposase InsO family protein